MSAYTMWYREGTVVTTKNTYNVTGVSTYWANAGINPGDMFTTDGSNFYEISEVTDSAHIVLKTPYLGESSVSSKYSIVRNFNSGGSSRVAAAAAELLGYFEKYIDTDMQSIHGRSAYEEAVKAGYTGTVNEWLESLSAYGVAVKNGYTGTVEEWLESLKAAGEWSELNARTSILTLDTAEVHNSIAGFRNKGTELTDEQKTAIKNHTWEDMYIGDYWTLNGHTYRIAKFMNGILVNNFATLYKGIMMLSNVLYKAPMNETDTNEGGYANSWMHATGLAQAGEIIAQDFGDLIMSFREYLYSGNTSGYLLVNHSMGNIQQPYKCMLPTYRMLTGRTYQGYPQDWFNYYSNFQIPLTQFDANQFSVLNGGNFWCQECFNSSTSFVNWVESGVLNWSDRVYLHKASNNGGVRVIFFIG